MSVDSTPHKRLIESTRAIIIGDTPLQVRCRELADALESTQEQLDAARAGQSSLFAENMKLKGTLERIRDWRDFRHTGEVRDAAGAALSNPASRQDG